MARGDIPLHPEHGLNPTVPICFWCGEDKNEVALLGRNYKGQAPTRMLLDYNPCDQCAGKIAQGVHCIEIVPKAASKFPPLAPDGALAYMAPTGRWAVIKPEAVDGIFPDRADELRKAGKCVMEHEVYEAIFGGANEKG